MASAEKLAKTREEILETPVSELVALATAFVVLSEEVMDQYPDSADAPAELAEFLKDMAQAVDSLLPDTV